MPIARVETIYSPEIPEPGQRPRVEDGKIVQPPFFGAIDGFSAPHSAQKPEQRFGTLSGGEIVRAIIERMFLRSGLSPFPENLLRLASREISKIGQSAGISTWDSGRLAGASFAIAKVWEDKRIEIIQAGDCLAVWSTTSGKIGFTSNQAFSHVSQNLAIIAELMQKHNNQRSAMRVEFAPLLEKRRQKDINNPMSTEGYAVINGQPNLERLWQRIDILLKDLEILLLFTDGLIADYQETSPERIQALAARMIQDYKTIGLRGILEQSRLAKSPTAASSYISQDEATAVAVVFRDPQ